MTYEQARAILTMADRYADSRRTAAWAEARAGWTEDRELRETLYGIADQARDAGWRQRKALARIVEAAK